MGKNIRLLLVVLSIALNIAFFGTWVWHGLAESKARDAQLEEPGTGCAASCALHRRLNVDDAQWRKIEPHFAEFHQGSQEVCRTMHRLRRELIDLLAAPNPDREVIRQKQEEILAGHRRIQELVVDQLLREREVLTAEQQEKLFNLLREGGACAGAAVNMGAQPAPAAAEHSGKGDSERTSEPSGGK